MKPGPALALLAGAVAAALLASHVVSLAALTVVLAVVCIRARGRRAWFYLVGIAWAAAVILVFTPLVETLGSHPLWAGPIVPVIGQIDVTSEELWSALHGALRLASVGLAFSAYALLVDHDRLLESASFARRFVLGVVLTTRLVPALERDARGFAEAMRARGVEVHGIKKRGVLLSPLVAGSLERSLNLAEAMEARGFGAREPTRLPAPRWTALDCAAIALAVAVICAGALWL